MMITSFLYRKRGKNFEKMIQILNYPVEGAIGKEEGNCAFAMLLGRGWGQLEAAENTGTLTAKGRRSAFIQGFSGLQG